MWKRAREILARTTFGALWGIPCRGSLVARDFVPHVEREGPSLGLFGGVFFAEVFCPPAIVVFFIRWGFQRDPLRTGQGQHLAVDRCCARAD